MKTIVSIITMVLTLSYAINAQTLTYQWAKSMGGAGAYAESYSITTDATGNVYSVGRFQDTVDFDPGSGIFNLIAYSTFSDFIQKLDSNGNFIWAKSIGNSGSNTEIRSITTDVSGNIYTTGKFRGTVDFDPGPDTFNLTSNAGTWDLLILKLDANGNFIWAKSMDGTSNSLQSHSITTDASGNVYTTGRFTLTVDFDPGPGIYNLTSIGGTRDIYIHKLDPNGNFIWAKSMGNGDYDEGRSITTDASGNVYTTGDFGGTVDFDPGPDTLNLTSNGQSDIFVQKLNSNGNFIWAKSMGDTDEERGQSITLDDFANVYTTGYFNGSADFDPGTGVNNLTSNGDSDIFIQKLDGNGNFVWAKSMGGLYEDEGVSISTDALGNVYTTGGFSDTVDFDPGPAVNNLTPSGADFFLQKLDNNGNFIWAARMGLTYGDYVHSMTTDISGNVYTTGVYAGTVDFDPGSAVNNLTCIGWNDCFIQKLIPGNNNNFVELITQNKINVTIFPNPTLGVLNIKFNNFNAPINYSICNALGQKLQQGTFRNINNIISTDKLTSGLYFLVFETKNRSAIKFKKS
ncbi:MAG: SBBP repeat-containing protein [Saprospiraceae bacterium]|nr:SBBP repeat-containing protein [Saprospiraceae bacterium]